MEPPSCFSSSPGKDSAGNCANSSEMGEPSSIVQERLVKVALAFGIDAARVSAFPTYFMVSMGSGEPVVLTLRPFEIVTLRVRRA